MSKQKMWKACLLAMVCLSTTIACHKDEGALQSVSPLEKASEMARLYNGELSQATIQFQSNSQQGDVTGRMSVSGGKTQLFTLQTDPKDGLVTTPKDGRYEVLYLRHLIVLNSLENGDKLILIVSKEESSNLLSKMPSSYTKGTKMLFGYGLSMNYAAGARSASCGSSGGAGSVSCSNTCCSVSCRTGYYSDCGEICRCRRELT